MKIKKNLSMADSLPWFIDSTDGLSITVQDLRKRMMRALGEGLGWLREELRSLRSKVKSLRNEVMEPGSMKVLLEVKGDGEATEASGTITVRIRRRTRLK